MWSAPMHDADWVKLTLSEVQKRKGELGGYEKVHGLLTAVSEVSDGAPVKESIIDMWVVVKVDWVKPTLSKKRGAWGLREALLPPVVLFAPGAAKHPPVQSREWDECHAQAHTSPPLPSPSVFSRIAGVQSTTVSTATSVGSALD